MVRVGLCPGESCEYGYSVVACEDLRLRTSEAANAEEILTVRKGDTATVVTGNLHLIAPGIVLIKRDYAVTDIDLDYERDDGKTSMPATDTLRFFAGDTLYVLNYLDLGAWDWWYRGKAGAGEEFWSGPLQTTFSGRKDLPAVSISEPRGDWWYKLRTQSGSEGWIRTPRDGWWEEKKFVETASGNWKCPP
jgi:hypothetical protein